MYARDIEHRKGSSRIIAAALSIGIQVSIGAALVYGLAPDFTARAIETFSSVTLDPLPKPPPPPPPPKSTAHAASGKSSPANTRAKAAEVIAAPQKIPLPVPVRAAVIPAVGSADHSGAAAIAGPGSGAGGLGNGTGSGDAGDGEGAGGSEIVWTGGRIKDADYPHELRSAPVEGTTSMDIVVSANGRPTACRVVGSSGSSLLDQTACRLALQRFHYRPATNRAGEPVTDHVIQDHEWAWNHVAEYGETR